jgi:DNA modification methylase
VTEQNPAAKHKIVYRSPDGLQADPRNSNTHPPEQIEQLRKSIRRYGFTKPVMLKADGSTIGAGHGAWMAAKLEGLAEIPTIALQLSDEDWRAYAILDNRLPRNAEWNEAILAAELAALHRIGFDLNDMGFGDLELGTLGVEGFELENRIQRAEQTPALNSNPVVERGELWALGDHRLLVGDSTDAASVGRLLDGARPVLMVTDPPYGVSYDPNWRSEVGVNRVIGSGATGKISNDDRADWTPAWQLFPGNTAYVWHGGLHSGVVEASLRTAGFEPRAQIIWDKGRLIISRGDYHWEHEPCWYVVRDDLEPPCSYAICGDYHSEHELCWYVVRKGKPGGYVGDRKQTTMWRIEHRISETGHGAQKPIECMRRPILNSSKLGDGIYDPFCGSGTTLIAAHMEKRTAFAMEIDPIYAQVIIERWENFAGKEAAREDGTTLDELKTAKLQQGEMVA